MEYVLFDGIFILVTALAAVGISRCGGVRAGLWVVGILLSAVVVLNLFETATKLLIRQYAGNRNEMAWPYGRFICLLVLFAGSLVLVHYLYRWLLPEDPKLPAKAEFVLRWGFGIAGGYLAAAVFVIAIHTFPGLPDFGGYFPANPADRPGLVMRTGPDYHLLKMTQIASEGSFPIGGNGELYPEELEAIGQETGRWAAFPLRYELWRKTLEKDRKEREAQERADAEAAERDAAAEKSE